MSSASRTWRGSSSPPPRASWVHALKEETGLPVHFHTHDTSGIAGASVLAAVEAGVDAVDLAMDSLSGFTSQPCLGSVVEALRGRPRDTGLDPARVRELSDYWEAVRAQYAAFETDMRAPASEVYLHEMPGGQFTNFREQARALGLAERWHEVANAYAEVNRMFGDIVKVTPTSKVVGDLALVMVSGGLTRADVEDPDRDIAFPESVVGLFRGELGRMPGGFPEPLARKILKGEKPIEGRPGAALPPADLAVERARAEAATGWSLSEEELYSYLLYPKVFVDYAERREKYGPLSALPTGVFFYGLAPGREASVELDRGLTLVIRCLAIGETDEEGSVRVFYELNGQAALGQGGEPRGSGGRRPAAEGRSGQPLSRSRADAGRRGLDGHCRRARSGRGRSPDDHRSDEDGDRSARRARRYGRGDPRDGGAVGRCQGPPAGVREGVSGTAGAVSSGLDIGQHRQRRRRISGPGHLARPCIPSTSLTRP